MGFQKHSWIKYGRQGDIVKIEIFDSSGGKIDSFQTNNKKDYAKIIKMIKDKYDFSPEIEKEEFTKEKSGWLDKNLNWDKD